MNILQVFQEFIKFMDFQLHNWSWCYWYALALTLKFSKAYYCALKKMWKLKYIICSLQYEAIADKYWQWCELEFFSFALWQCS